MSSHWASHWLSVGDAWRKSCPCSAARPQQIELRDHLPLSLAVDLFCVVVGRRRSQGREPTHRPSLDRRYTAPSPWLRRRAFQEVLAGRVPARLLFHCRQSRVGSGNSDRRLFIPRPRRLASPVDLENLPLLRHQMRSSSVGAQDPQSLARVVAVGSGTLAVHHEAATVG